MSNGVQLKIEVDSSRIIGEVDNLAHQGVVDWRQEMVKTVLKEVLTRTIERAPVDEGRLRSSWVQQITSLGGTVPSGWQGTDPDNAAIREGATDGEVLIETDEETTQMDSVNHVEYAKYVEYGTQKMDAEHMAGESLEETLLDLEELIPPLIPS